MKEAINATIQRILRTDRGITANQVLVDDLGFDSLKLFQLITELEDEFDTPSLSATHRTSKQWETSTPASRSGSPKPPSRPHLGKEQHDRRRRS